MKQVISPIDLETFESKIQISQEIKNKKYLEFFSPYIENAHRYAIGPFFWIITENVNLSMVAVSENIEEFTGATKADWLKASPMMFFSRVHPEDADYIMGSLALIKNLIESKSISERDYLRYNIYCRFLKKNGEYEWFLWQCPAIFFSEKNEIEANFSLMVEMPQLASIIDVPIMTLIDNNQKENQYFKVLAESKSLKGLNLPNITKREQEVIRLMASGFKTPEIAEKLFISEITVEHHKKNLRVKTETKTSVELMSFVMKNNLI